MRERLTEIYYGIQVLQFLNQTELEEELQEWHRTGGPLLQGSQLSPLALSKSGGRRVAGAALFAQWFQPHKHIHYADVAKAVASLADRMESQVQQYLHNIPSMR